MLIRLVSDLHLEFDPTYRLPHTEKDKNTILVLAGDIAVIEKFDSAIPFFRDVCDRFYKVIYIFGNHEFYKGSITRAHVKLNESLAKDEFDYSNLFILENSSIELDNVLFLGTTLWSDHDKGNPISLLNSNLVMNDFKLIRTGPINAPYLKKFKSDDAVSLFSKNLKWLTDVFSKNTDKSIVVITHHAPTHLSLVRESNVNGAYASDLYEFIENNKPVLWFHGHTHSSLDYKVGETRVICNPKGYPVRNDLAKYENNCFDPILEIEI